MFNKTKIESALTGLVGFRQPIDPDYAIIDSNNQISRSGRFINDNPFCKVKYIKEIHDYKDISDIDFNSYLLNKQKSAIATVMDKVFNKPDFIDRQVLYQNANNKTETEILIDGFVGYEIEVSYDKSWAYEISRVILELQGTGSINLMLLNSNSKEPLFQKTINITSELQEEYLNWRIDNTNIVYKGKYYLGYTTNGLTVLPFKRDYQNSKIMSVITGMCFRQIEVKNHNTQDLFDLDSIDGSDINIGVNPDITVFNDYTDIIIQNQFLFADAIEKQLIIDYLSEIIASDRFNQVQRNAKDMLKNIVIEIEGINIEDSIKKTGLKMELMGQINHIRKEIEKLKNGYFSSGFLLNTLN